MIVARTDFVNVLTHCQVNRVTTSLWPTSASSRVAYTRSNRGSSHDRGMPCLSHANTCVTNLSRSGLASLYGTPLLMLETIRATGEVPSTKMVETTTYRPGHQLAITVVPILGGVGCGSSSIQRGRIRQGAIACSVAASWPDHLPSGNQKRFLDMMMR